MTDEVPEQVPEQQEDNRLRESAAEAWNAALKALYALILVLFILLGRALQALFVLARPAVLVGTVIAAGYTSVTLFQTVLVRYGGDLPAVVLALAAVVIVPASLLVLAGNYGIWATALATATLEFLAHLGLQRAPPIVLAFIPVLALATTVFYFLAHTEDVPETSTESRKENDDEQGQQRGSSATVDHNGSTDYLHGQQELRSNQQDTAA